MAKTQDIKRRIRSVKNTAQLTRAMKMVAASKLRRAQERILKARDQRVTIVGATSGDTGSAALAACQGKAQIEIFILHPRGRVSEVQRRQMTTVEAENAHNIAIEGTFDDCQDLVKALFNDAEFRDELALSAVNSINWARVMAQIVYYFAAAVALAITFAKSPASVSLAGVGAENFVNNEVESSVQNAGTRGVEARSGSVRLTAIEDADIDAVPARPSGTLTARVGEAWIPTGDTATSTSARSVVAATSASIAASSAPLVRPSAASNRSDPVAPYRADP